MEIWRDRQKLMNSLHARFVFHHSFSQAVACMIITANLMNMSAIRQEQWRNRIDIIALL